ncbi:MAG: serine/threonine protein kinase, partial [Candidatus Eisenbacteria bacterium]|nr:serine/threonine protein kinase [Candidatus Eisenbacteria bacterium]
HAHRQSDNIANARLLAEARAATTLNGGHFAEILAVRTFASGVPYLVLEYLEGEPLDELLARRGHLSVDEAMWLFVETARALEAAHRHGIVHRDIKPSNIFLSIDPATGATVLKLLDLGIAKLDPLRALGGVSLTGATEALGTPRYMSPEQLTDSRSVEASSDVWSLGV